MKVIAYNKEKRIFYFENGYLAYAGKGDVVLQGKKAIVKNTGAGYKKAIDAIIKYLDNEKAKQ